jgi:hypothetical protein
VGFGLFDAFLEFFLKDFFEKSSSLEEEELFEIVEGFSEGGVVGDEVAFGEEGGELLREKVANGGRGRLHKIRPCKRGPLTSMTQTIVPTTH